MKQKQLKKLEIVDLGVLDYGQALDHQHRIVARRIKGLCPDHLLLVEHPPVVTIGRSGSLGDIRVTREVLDQKGVVLHQVDRGGMATFHGPGQLVVYPIVKLEDPDVHAFLEQLLGTVDDVLKEYHLATEYKTGQPGLWVNGGKIASVGLSVQHQVTSHGIAVNVNIDPAWFDLINPCGHKGAKIASMTRELSRPIDMSAVKKSVVAQFSRRMGYAECETEAAGAGPRPEWLIKPAGDLAAIALMEKRLETLNLATVCQSAHCPNLGECFGLGNATFIILGTSCTRRCRFCAVDKGKPQPVDSGEPERIAMAVQELGLCHAVVTSVTRDDLPDGGAGQFAATIRQIRQYCPGVSVEVLVPDFRGHIPSLDRVCAERPEVFNHNIETIPRLYAGVRPGAEYRRSLGVLSYAASRGLIVKSGLMLGLGENDHEIKKVLMDLKYAGCTLLTLGQYLAPSKEHVPVDRYVSPETFQKWADVTRIMGFKAVAAGPLVRSSYRAGQMIGRTRDSFHNNIIRKAS